MVGSFKFLIVASFFCILDSRPLIFSFVFKFQFLALYEHYYCLCIQNVQFFYKFSSSSFSMQRLKSNFKFLFYLFNPHFLFYTSIFSVSILSFLVFNFVSHIWVSIFHIVIFAFHASLLSPVLLFVWLLYVDYVLVLVSVFCHQLSVLNFLLPIDNYLRYFFFYYFHSVSIFYCHFFFFQFLFFCFSFYCFCFLIPFFQKFFLLFCIFLPLFSLFSAFFCFLTSVNN